jgi:hypothetical protein
VSSRTRYFLSLHRSRPPSLGHTYLETANLVAVAHVFRPGLGKSEASYLVVVQELPHNHPDAPALPASFRSVAEAINDECVRNGAGPRTFGDALWVQIDAEGRVDEVLISPHGPIAWQPLQGYLPPKATYTRSSPNLAASHLTPGSQAALLSHPGGADALDACSTLAALALGPVQRVAAGRAPVRRSESI